jgi:WD40 repeat protein
MSEGWKYSKNGTLSGLVTAQQVASLIRAGELRGDDAVWSKELGSWQPVSEVAEWILSRADSAGAAAVPSPAEPSKSGRTSSETPIAEKAAEPTAAPTPATKPDWRFSRDGKLNGPVSVDRIIEMIRSGELSADDMVWHADLGAWQPIREVRQKLFAAADKRVSAPATISTTAPSAATVLQSELQSASLPPSGKAPSDARRMNRLLIWGSLAAILAIATSASFVWWHYHHPTELAVNRNSSFPEPSKTPSVATPASKSAETTKPRSVPQSVTKTVSSQPKPQSPTITPKPSEISTRPSVATVIPSVPAPQTNKKPATNQVFRLRDGKVNAVLIDAENNLLLTGGNSVSRTLRGRTYVNEPGSDNTIRFWNLETGNQSAVIDTGLGQGRTWMVQGIAMSADHTQLAVTTGRGSADWGEPTLTVWDRATRRRTHHFPLLGRAVVKKPWFSQDGKTLYILRGDATLQIFDLNTDKMVRDAKLDSAAEENDLHALCMSADRSLLFGGMRDGKIKVWSLATSKVKQEFSEHTEMVHALALSADEKYLASSSNDGMVLVRETAGGKIVARLRHGGKVLCVGFVEGTNQVVSGGDDKLAVLWDFSTQTRIKQFEGHTDAVSSLSISTNGALLATGSADGTARSWALGPSVEPTKVATIVKPIETVSATTHSSPAAVKSASAWVYYVPMTTGATISGKLLEQVSSFKVGHDEQTIQLTPRSDPTAGDLLAADVTVIDAASTAERPLLGLTVNPKTGQLRIDRVEPEANINKVVLQLLDSHGQLMVEARIATPASEPRLAAIIEAQRQVAAEQGARNNAIDKRTVAERLRTQAQNLKKQYTDNLDRPIRPPARTTLQKQIIAQNKIIAAQTTSYNAADAEVRAAEQRLKTAESALEQALDACKQVRNENQPRDWPAAP